MTRYNDETTKAQGLINEEKLNDNAFLSLIREGQFTSERLQKIEGDMKKAHAQITTVESYSRYEE